jgi:hypothetical protein
VQSISVISRIGSVWGPAQLACSCHGPRQLEVRCACICCFLPSLWCRQPAQTPERTLLSYLQRKVLPLVPGLPMLQTCWRLRVGRRMGQRAGRQALQGLHMPEGEVPLHRLRYHCTPHCSHHPCRMSQASHHQDQQARRLNTVGYARKSHHRCNKGAGWT